jgi:hypothetical protein
MPNSRALSVAPFAMLPAKLPGFICTAGKLSGSSVVESYNSKIRVRSHNKPQLET